jgi:hypothetical protein
MAETKPWMARAVGTTRNIARMHRTTQSQARICFRRSSGIDVPFKDEKAAGFQSNLILCFRSRFLFDFILGLSAEE